MQIHKISQKNQNTKYNQNRNQPNFKAQIPTKVLDEFCTVIGEINEHKKPSVIEKIRKAFLERFYRNFERVKKIVDENGREPVISGISTLRKFYSRRGRSILTPEKIQFHMTYDPKNSICSFSVKGIENDGQALAERLIQTMEESNTLASVREPIQITDPKTQLQIRRAVSEAVRAEAAAHPHEYYGSSDPRDCPIIVKN